ncbi:MAG: hypothetical protein ACI8RU_000419 [Zhongshania aliphaticivorans]|jgi:hypothetical protein|uniref:hypothetical protein n=1 Tax=Zhongshania aliphaticivorans TaxID=1470434 RepID=UPI0039E6CD14
MSILRIRTFIGMLCTCIALAAQLTFATTASAAPARHIEINSTLLTEMSGITASAHHNNRYWAHNDSGDRPRLVAFNEQGQHLTELRVKGANAFDWEDIDSFSDTTGSYLVLADIGDNMAFRPYTDVYVIAEPNVLKSPVMEASVQRHFMLINEDGARDVEALAVDSRERFVYLLSKRDLHPRLYRFSLDALTGKPVPLNYLGEIRSIPSIDKHQAQGAGRITRFSPTAMAFSPNGDAAIIVTLGKTYYFPRKQNQSWLQALNATPVVVNVKPLPQIEAGTFSLDGKRLLIGSEGVPAKMEILDRPAAK